MSQERRLVSYAWNHEDVLLHRAFQEQHRGFYIDVGANHPVLGSITYNFYRRGWNGINIEPVVAEHRRLVRHRPRDVNLNVGVSNEEGEMTLYTCRRNTALSTLSHEESLKLGVELMETTVSVLTLASICERYVGEHEIDFMSIDVEGFEKRVLESNDWSRWRPRVLVIESTVPGETEASHELWEPIVIREGYSLALFDGLNRFYARDDEPQLLGALRIPVNCFDNFRSLFHRAPLSTAIGHLLRLRASRWWLRLVARARGDS